MSHKADVILCGLNEAESLHWVDSIPATAHEQGWCRANYVATGEQADPVTGAVVVPITIPKLPEMMIAGFLPISDKTNLKLAFSQSHIRCLIVDLLQCLALQKDTFALTIIQAFFNDGLDWGNDALRLENLCCRLESVGEQLKNLPIGAEEVALPDLLTLVKHRTYGLSEREAAASS